MSHTTTKTHFNFQKVASYDYCDYMVDLKRNVVYINITEDVAFNLEMGKELFYKVFEFFPTQKVYVIINISERTQVDASVLDFIASEERFLKVCSDAFIITSLALKLVSNFYLKIKKPKIKTKVFNDIQEAFYWTLEQQRILK